MKLTRKEELHFAFCGGKIIMEDKRIDIVIVVKDGLVQNVYASHRNCHVDIFDIDGISHMSDEESTQKINKFRKTIKKLTTIL